MDKKSTTYKILESILHEQMATGCVDAVKIETLLKVLSVIPSYQHEEIALAVLGGKENAE